MALELCLLPITVNWVHVARYGGPRMHRSGTCLAPWTGQRPYRPRCYILAAGLCPLHDAYVMEVLVSCEGCLLQSENAQHSLGAAVLLARSMLGCDIGVEATSVAIRQNHPVFSCEWA